MSGDIGIQTSDTLGSRMTPEIGNPAPPLEMLKLNQTSTKKDTSTEVIRIEWNQALEAWEYESGPKLKLKLVETTVHSPRKKASTGTPAP